MSTTTNTHTAMAPEGVAANDLERWLRGSRAVLLAPPVVRPGLLDRLKMVGHLLEQAGAVAATPALIFRSQPGEVRSQAVGAGLVVGRKPPSGLLIADPQISRRHFEIRREAECCVLSDLDSRNGTRVNGKRVTRRVLRAGDAIEVGSQLIVFVA